MMNKYIKSLEYSMLFSHQLFIKDILLMKRETTNILSLSVNVLMKV